MERFIEILNKNRERVVWGAIALAVFVGGGIYYWWNTNRTKMERGEIGYIKSLIIGFRDKGSLEDVVKTSKGTIWGDMALLDLANAFYSQGNLKEARKYVDEISGKNFATSAAKNSYLYAITSDVNYLKKAYSSEYSSISEYFKIKLAENFIESGKFKEAEEILKPLAENHFSPYNSKAMTLLKLAQTFKGR